jgi:hypothetical protein
MIELGTAKAGIITVGNVLISVFGWSRAITCNGPGELSIPTVIATAKSARPSRFHKIPNFLPTRVPEDTQSAAGQAKGLCARKSMIHELLPFILKHWKLIRSVNRYEDYKGGIEL